MTASITGTNPGSLTESNLNGATVTVTITNGTYDASLATSDFTLNGAPTGTTIDVVVWDSATQATLTLAFDGTDFDTNASMSVTVLQAALATGTGPATTGTVTVTSLAEIHRSVGTTATDLNTGGETVAISGTTATFGNPMPDNIGVGDVITYTGGTDSAFIHDRISSTQYTVTDKDGNTPTGTAATAASVWRAYTSLADAVGTTLAENVNIPAAVENDVDPARDLTVANTVLMIAAYGDATVDSAVVDINGWTTGSTNYIRIYTPVSASEVGTRQRHSGKWTSSGAYILDIATTVSVKSITVNERYVRIEGLQIEVTSTVDFYTAIFVPSVSASGSDVRISHNVLQSDGGAFKGNGIEVSGGSGDPIVKAWNNVVYGFEGSGTGAIVTWGGDLYSYNNTVFNSGFCIRVAASTLHVAKNNVVINCTNDHYLGTFDAASTNNAAATDTPTGASNNIDLTTNVVTDYFVSSTDAHINRAATYAGELIDAGADLSSDSTIPFSDDIHGYARPAGSGWDIGADESAAQSLYRSVGTDGTNLNTGQTVEIVGTRATFSASMPNTIGVGDVLQYGSTNLAFIHGRTSDTVYTVQSATGGTPVATAALTPVSLFRAYTSLFNWEAQTENTSIDPSVRNFDTSTNLDSDDTIMQVAAYADGADTDGSEVTIGSEWFTAADNYIRIYTPVSTSEVGVSQRHTGLAGTGYVRRPTSDPPANPYALLEISTHYVRLEGIELDGSLLANAEELYGIEITVASGSTDIRIEHGLIHDLTTSNASPGSVRYTYGIRAKSGLAARGRRGSS